jgi:hypothetical protein
MGKRKEGITTITRLKANCSIADREDPDCCWIWKGAVRGKRAAIWLPKTGEVVTGPRAAATLSGTEIPQGYRVWPTCCRSDCCNPRHAVVGTYLEWGTHVREKRLWVGNEKNIAAAKARGRERSKIDLQLAREIRESGLSQRREAQRVKEKHGIEISRHLVSNVRTGKRWAEPNPFAGLGAR